MKVHLRILRQGEELQETLKNDGWQLQPEKDNSFSARHPEVLNEDAARSRLHRLDLLTSSSVWIEFQRASR
jgi:hypothetical protein